MQLGWAILAVLMAPLAGLAIPDSVYAQRSPQSPNVVFDYSVSQISPVNLSIGQILSILNHEDPTNALVNEYDQKTCDAINGCNASLAPVKVVQTDVGSCIYLGVFHTYIAPRFVSYASCATDLRTPPDASTDYQKWKTRGAIDDVSKNEYGSQPDIRILPDDSLLFAEEFNPANRPQIRVRYYGNQGGQTGLRAFIDNPGITPTIEQVLPNINNSSYADGTPEFGRIAYETAIRKSQIEITHHYFYLGQRDLQAVGTLNDFKRWSDKTDTLMNELITEAGGNGKIGDREVFRVGFTAYEVVEAQVNPPSLNDFGSWRLFLVDKTNTNNRPILLDPKLDTIDPNLGYAKSLGNPTISFVTVDGVPALVFTCFVFSENSNGTKSGGHMYVYPLK